MQITELKNPTALHEFHAETSTNTSFALKDARLQLDQCIAHAKDQILRAGGSQQNEQLQHLTLLEQRTHSQLPRLTENLSTLYGHTNNFNDVFRMVLDTFIAAGLERPTELRKLDLQREQDPLWFASNKTIEASLYVDRHCGALNKLEEEINLFKALHVNMVHLMPTVYKLPSGDHDGGYAISDFRTVNPELGTMDQLRNIFSAMRKESISPAMDVTVNHTAHDHPWAQAAKAGDPEKQAFYFFMDRAEKDEYQPHLPDIFPDIRKGSFTWNDDTAKYVWTTFKSTQWDLNYSNPDVLASMAKELMFLANQGAEVLRFDAVPFIWKTKGTDCFGQANVLPILRIYNAMAKIAAPSLVFKSEAINEPKKIKPFVGSELCQLGYNPMIPSHLWDALARQDIRFMASALTKHMQEPDGRTWVNYSRCHDELALPLDEELAMAHGITHTGQHKATLTHFYTDPSPQSFSSGIKFRSNPESGCISGTQASLAGVEKALTTKDPEHLQMAIDRIKLLNSVVMSVPGIPLINLIGGDDRGQINDYSFLDDDEKKNDSRWLHRPLHDIDLAKTDALEVQTMGKIFSDLAHLTRVRTQEMPSFGNGPMSVFQTGNNAVLGFLRGNKPQQQVMVLANFSDQPQHIDAQHLGKHHMRTALDKVDQTAPPLDLSQGISLKPYQSMWLISNPDSQSNAR